MMLPSRTPASRARPKSSTRTRPSSPMSTLSGLKSRWTSPRSCAAARPRPAATITSTTSRHDRPAAEPRPQGLAGHVLHGDEGLARHHPRVVDGDDVGVRQLRQRLRLPVQASGAFAAHAHPHQLERHVPIELGIVREVDEAHPPLADHAEQLVAPDALADGQLRLRRVLGLRGGGAALGVVRHRRGPSSHILFCAGAAQSSPGRGRQRGLARQ